MFHVVLYQPEIPPNTGNVIRLCANTGFNLHLVKPLGFEPDNTRLKRAGLDYHDWANVTLHEDLGSLLAIVDPTRLFTVSTHNPLNYTAPRYRRGDTFLFGPETRGLPAEIRDELRSQTRA